MSTKKPTLDGRIEALREIDTLGGLRSALVPVLHELAYHAIIGGEAETLDKWRDKYTEYLYQGVAQDFAAGAPREGSEAGRAGPEAYQPPPSRPAPSEVPASLRALLDREGDDSSDSGGESPDYWAEGAKGPPGAPPGPAGPSSRQRPPADERG